MEQEDWSKIEWKKRKSRIDCLKRTGVGNGRRGLE